MARSISTALLDHLRLPSRTVCTCWRVEPRYDMPVEGYTSLDRDLTIGGVVYSSVANVSPSAVPASLGLRDNSLDVETFPDLVIGNMTAARLQTGYYEEAEYEIFLVNYEGDLTDKAVLSAGRIGKGTRSDNGILFELRTWGDLLNRPIGHTIAPTCGCPRYGRGDCANVNGLNDGPDIADHSHIGTITTVYDKAHFVVSGVIEPEGWADFGYARWNDTDSDLYQPDGETTGFRIKKFSIPADTTKREIRLHNALPFLPLVGDAVVVERGCARDVAACKASPNRKDAGADDGTGNVVNMRWCAPYLPGATVVNTKQS